MTWIIEKAEAIGDRATITLKHVLADGTDEVDDKGNLVIRTLRHERTRFNGTLQTLAQWRANIKNEVKATIALWDAEEQAQTPTDITAAVS